MTLGRRPWLRWIAGFLVLVGGWILWQGSRGRSVDVVEVVRADVVQTLVALGRVAPLAQVEFAALEPTTVTQVLVREGQHVTAGELLLQMDHREADAMVLQSQAALEQAQAQARQLETVASPAARAALTEAQANLDETARQLERDEALFYAGALDAAAVDRARTALTISRTRTRAAQLQQAGLIRGGAQWQSAIAATMFAEAGLAAAKARRDRLQIRAPGSGTIIGRHVDVGDVVALGTPLATMTLEGPTHITVEPDEKNLQHLRPGLPAIASAEAIPDHRFTAVIDFVAPAVDPLRGSVEVRLAVSEPPAYLRTGMTVSVEIEIGRSSDTLSVPARAIHDLGSSTPWVLVVDQGVARRQTVELGLRGTNTVEVRAGIDVHDALIPADRFDVAEGDRVRRRGHDNSSP